MSDTESGEEIWSDDNNEPCVCLFCPQVLPSQDEFKSHAITTHGFDFLKTKLSLGMFLINIAHQQDEVYLGQFFENLHLDLQYGN